jgi:hypothetical protein
VERIRRSLSVLDYFLVNQKKRRKPRQKQTKLALAGIAGEEWTQTRFIGVNTRSRGQVVRITGQLAI